MTFRRSRSLLRSPAALSVALLLVVSCRISAASLPYSEDAPLTGGTAALARALGFDAVPDRARFVSELTRVLYETPPGRNASTDDLLQRLTMHLELVGQLHSALAAVHADDRGITLEMASRQPDRKPLEQLFVLIGVRLKQQKNGFSVEHADGKHAAERVQALAALGIDVDQLSARLNAGETVRLGMPIETVPIPLTAKLWGDAVFRRPIAIDDLAPAILGDRRAALLCHGLAALDAETLRFFTDHPAIVSRLYEHESAVFASFGDALHVRDGRITIPGGPGAIPLWEAALDERIDRPDRFIRELYGRSDGRIAYLYDTLAHLDAPHAAFALGLWMKDAGVRAERFKALVSSMGRWSTEWDPQAAPFSRAPNDSAMLLTRMRVGADGSPAPPSWRKFWERAFESSALPDKPDKDLSNVRDDGAIDAAWLIEHLGDAPPARAEQLQQLAFAQRAFGRAADQDPGNVLVAVRAVPRYGALMLAVERIGIRTPSVFAAAAWRAESLSSFPPNGRAFIALGQFQSALEVTTRLARVRAIDSDQAEALVKALAAVPIHDGRYAGGISGWMTTQLEPLIRNSEDIDASLTAALAGVSATPRRDVLVTWEDQRYRVDLVGAEQQRLSAVRARLGAFPVASALEVWRIATEIAAPSVSLPQVQRDAAALKGIAAGFPSLKTGDRITAVVPPGVDDLPNPREIASRAAQDLLKISSARDVGKAKHVAVPLLGLSDQLLADALMALAYALNIGGPDSRALMAGDVYRRHDFGFNIAAAEERLRTAWKEPAQDAGGGVPWHVKGALLGLDAALAPLAMRRLSAEGVPAPRTISGPDESTLTRSFGLLNPLDLLDADRDAIALAIRSGRERVAMLAEHPETADALTDEISMDGWRKRAVAWTLTVEPAIASTYFSLAELLRIGRFVSGSSLDAWGTAPVHGGCTCIEAPDVGRWPLFVGRPQVGLLPTQAWDLQLRVAVALHERRLPASLARQILAFAMQDYLDSLHPIDSNDWLAFARTAQAVTQERLDDYVAALTAAGGPLVPETAPGDK